MQTHSDRKNSHLATCLNEASVDQRILSLNGFDQWDLEHDALPELSLNEISLECELFGRRLSAPILIGAMTGGTREATVINHRLARAAQHCRVGMVLGSQRKQLENPDNEEVSASYRVRDVAPDLPLLIGNLGAVQLNDGVGPNEIRSLVKSVGAQAFCFHLNPLQEAIQPEGDTDFSGLLSKLRKVIAELDLPVMTKEVGSGISETTAKKLADLGLAAVETAGVGGTSWAKVEGQRHSTASGRKLGDLFRTWGISTAQSILNLRKHLPQTPIIASGGISNGIEIAKSMALGAQATALALPLLKAAAESEATVIEVIENLKTELRIALFVTGSKNPSELPRALRPNQSGRIS